MANNDEFPRGQLSTVILMCLAQTDKYGYEIIDEVLKKTNGKLSIKQPSLYSSLKRMEEQSLISSYWRDSEIGGRRHYYHLTDLGRKHLDKWKANINLDEYSQKEEVKNETNRVLQQESFFNLSKEKPKEELKQEEKTLITNQAFVQFDLFTDNQIITPADNDNNSYEQPLHAENNANVIKEQSPIMTSYEKVDIKPTVRKFDYVKKGKSFSDSIKDVNSFTEKKYIEKAITIESPIVNNFNSNEKVITALAPEVENIITSVETTPTAENSLQNHMDKISVKDLDGYKFNSQNTTFISLEEENQTENKFEFDSSSYFNLDNSQINQAAENNQINNNNTDFKQEEKPIKDDGVFITERLDIKDLPKPTRWDNRRFEIYLSDNSISPKFKSSTNEKYEDRLKDLYEKSKRNAENKELELIDSKLKFDSYQELQEFYKEQNIKFKPYQKSLHKSGKNFDMIRINKLNLSTSLLMLAFFSLLSILSIIVFSFVKNAYLNHIAFYISIPAIFIITSIFAFVQYHKAPQKRIAYDVNKFKFNKTLFFTNLLVTPIIFAINVLVGFSFSNFANFCVSIIYPSLISFTYLTYYLAQKILIKFKAFY